MSLGVVLLCSAITYTLFSYAKGLWDVNYLPGLRPLFSPLNPFSSILPKSSFILRFSWGWTFRENYFKNYTHDIVSVVPILPAGGPSLYVCSVDVFKQIIGHEHMAKPYHLTSAPLTGESVSTLNGDTWRRHRRVIMPGFGAKTMSAAWETAMETYQDMVQTEGWKESGKEVILTDIHTLVLNFTVKVLAKAGFGLSSTSSQSSTTEDVTSSLLMISKQFLPRLVTPRVAYKILPFEFLASLDTAWSNVRSFISTSLVSRREYIDDPDVEDVRIPGDILSRLVVASKGEKRFGMSEQEMISNMLTFLFAGHDTTTSSIVAAVAYLAYHHGEQQRAFEEIRTLEGTLTANYMSKLPFVTACWFEAQRLCPAVMMVPRTITGDVPVTVTHPSQQTFVLKKGTPVIFDLIAMSYNPNCFEDPHTFKPTRWFSKSDDDLTMFGFGPRACPGRKFAQHESVAFLVSLLRDWRLDIVLQPGETRAQYYDRVLGDCDMVGTALTIRNPGSFKLVPRGDA